MTSPLDNPEFKDYFYKNRDAPYRHCLWHTESCQNPPIRAHAVQNSRALDRIAENGHVTMVRHDVDQDGVHLSFREMGRNKATTFTGLCAEHDKQLFLPIDNAEIDP